MPKVGSAGGGKIQTCWELKLTLGIPFYRWGAQPFIIHPICFPTIIPQTDSETRSAEDGPKAPCIHPILLARLWGQQMKENVHLAKAGIAAREGLSRARVTQIMNLLELPPVIQDQVLNPPAPLDLQTFTEKRLRVLVACPDRETQASRWQELVQKLVTGSAER